jgi:hypothetical protein
VDRPRTAEETPPAFEPAALCGLCGRNDSGSHCFESNAKITKETIMLRGHKCVQESAVGIERQKSVVRQVPRSRGKVSHCVRLPRDMVERRVVSMVSLV